MWWFGRAAVVVIAVGDETLVVSAADLQGKKGLILLFVLVIVYL